MKVAQKLIKNDLLKCEWGELKISDIFTSIKRGKRLIERDREKGNIPYYSASSINNGLTDLISNPLFITQDKIIISTFCDAYYVEGKFTASDEITICGNDKLNKYNGLFICRIIKNNQIKYAFGRKAFQERLEKQVLKLPINSKKEPDWEFMESFMKELEKTQLKTILKYYENKMKVSAKSTVGGGHYKELINACAKDFALNSSFCKNPENLVDFNLTSLQWGEFNFQEIFEKIQRGKRLTKQNQIRGKKPYVSSSSFNNGVDNFIDNDFGVREFKSCISLANSGSVGSAFFHSYKFIASDHITKLENKHFNKYIYLFMLPLINRLSQKYSFNREINDKRIKREKLILPIDSKGQPNFEFMESFMKELEQIQIHKIIKYYQTKNTKLAKN